MTPESLVPQTCAQAIEGLPLVFVPAAAEGLDAVIQFDITGDEPGQWVVTIREGSCTVHQGRAESPALTIHAPSRVWLAISRGERNPTAAYMSGQWSHSGSMSLLMRLPRIFPAPAPTAGP